MDHFKHKNVLVTGCTGLLGAWLTKRLVNSGANVVGVIRDWTPKSNLILDGTIQKVTQVRGAVEDYEFITRVINEHEIEVVFHLAAQTIVGTANNSPLSTFESNIKGTWSLLEACRLNKRVKKVIVASSDKAYGDQKVLPYTEQTPLQGVHPYDVSKSCADLICNAYHVSYGVPVAITRCGNFFGGGDLNLNRIVPGTIVSLIRGEDPIIRSNGKLIRDYIYVEDGVDAYLHLAKAMDDPKIHGQAFNFSYEKPMSVIQVVEKISKAMKSTRKPRILNQASNEIIDQHLDSSKAKKQLGWKPVYDLDKGLVETVSWYKANFADVTAKKEAERESTLV